MREQGRLGWVRAVALVLMVGILSPQAWSLDLDHRIAHTERDSAQILSTLGRGARASHHAGGLTLKLKKKKKKIVRKAKRSHKVRS